MTADKMVEILLDYLHELIYVNVIELNFLTRRYWELHTCYYYDFNNLAVLCTRTSLNISYCVFVLHNINCDQNIYNIQIKVLFL